MMDPFEAAMMSGQVQGGMNPAPMGNPTITPDMMPQRVAQAAQELAKNLPPPPPGQLGQLMQNPQLMQMLMGSVQGYGDEKQKMQQAAMSRHFVNPPFSGTGKGMEPVVPQMYALAGKRRQGQPVSSLGSLLKGG